MSSAATASAYASGATSPAGSARSSAAQSDPAQGMRRRAVRSSRTAATVCGVGATASWRSGATTPGYGPPRRRSSADPGRDTADQEAVALVQVEVDPEAAHPLELDESVHRAAQRPGGVDGGVALEADAAQDGEDRLEQPGAGGGHLVVAGRRRPL